jgi:hypothetical protein
MTHNGKSRTQLARTAEAIGRRETLVRQADDVRTKLMRTVEQLDQRRHRLQGLRADMTEQVKRVAVTAGLVLLAAVGAAAYTVERLAGAAARRRRTRWRLAKDAWNNPSASLKTLRGNMRPERRSFFGEVIRSLLLAIVTTAVTIPARRTVAALLKGKEEKEGTDEKGAERTASSGQR